uniref:Uncharacterized protein n=1 Tax=Strongyloides stercoralis TaxID=6248 RepID=A0A0K0DUB6_STRER
MKKYYFGNGVRRSFMSFGGVVPEIKKLDYEVPYVDPARIYGLDNGGKVYQKNKSAELKGLEKNHFLGSGDCESNGSKMNLNKTQMDRSECSLKSSVSQNIPEITRNKYKTLPCTESNISIQHNKNINSSLSFKSLQTPSTNKSLNNINLEELKKFNTPIKPPDIQMEKNSIKTSNTTPRFNKTWKNCRTNLQRKITKTKLPKTFTIPNFFKNNNRINNDKNINNYQESCELKELHLPTTILNPIIEKPQTIGGIQSLKEEFQMYRECYKIQKADPSTEEQLQNNCVENFQQIVEKKPSSLLKKMYFYISKCLYCKKT